MHHWNYDMTGKVVANLNNIFPQIRLYYLDTLRIKRLV